MKRYASTFVVISFFCFSLLLSAENNRWTKWLNNAKSNMTKIIFYGKIIDQYGNPVSNAKINLSVRVPRIIPKPDFQTKIESDLNGCFEYNGNKGGVLFIDNIKKNGYEYSNNMQVTDKTSFEYRKDRTALHHPDPKKPVIFHMRKKGKNPIYLIINNSFEIEPSFESIKKFSFIDLEYSWDKWKEKELDKLLEIDDTDFDDKQIKKIEKSQEKIEKMTYKNNCLPDHYDFKVSAVFDKKKYDWTVILTANGKDGGFILDDRFLSEAPKDGYQKEFKIIQHVATEKEEEAYNNIDDDDGKAWEEFEKLTESKIKAKYLYIKSRDPAIYTRMEITDVSMDVDSCIIYTSIATNPYGERNLERNVELPLDISDECADYEKYFFKGTLPPKPNMKKIWNKFKKTHKQVKSGENGRLVWEKIEK